MTLLVDLIVLSAAQTAVDDLLRSTMQDPEGSTSLVAYSGRYYCGVVMTSAQWSTVYAGINLHQVGYLVSTNKASEGRHALTGNLRVTAGQGCDHEKARERGTDWFSNGLLTDTLNDTL